MCRLYLAALLGLQVWVPARLVCQQVVPAGTPLEIRLTKRISTNASRPGTPVEAILSAPLVQDGKVLLPQGATVKGTVVDVSHVGLGFRHETASMAIRIDEIIPPVGGSLAISSQVAQIENSREKVDPRTGKIRGVRATSTLSHKVSGMVGAFAFSNPVALIFTTAGSAAVLRFADPEFSLPANAELMLKLTAPLTIDLPTDETLPEVATEEDDQAMLRDLVRQEPYRTVTDKKHIPSDITNLMFIGSHGALQRAFAAAGWLQVNSLNADSTYKTVRSITEQQAYRTAPMSTLLLEDRAPVDAFAKTMDTFSARHHLRVFSTQESWAGRPVWLSSSTQDIGIGFSGSKKTFIHQIDHNVDHERNKVVNDLLLTGCVKGINLVERDWLPKDLMNGTGEPIQTDNRMAVVMLSDCELPEHVPDLAETDAAPLHANIAVKAVRQTVLSLRDTMLRDNIGVTAYGMVHGVMAAKHPKPPEPPIVPDSEILLARYAIGSPVGESDQPVLLTRSVAPANSLPKETAPRSAFDKYTAPTVELGIHGGWAGFAGGDPQNPGYGGYIDYYFADQTDPTGNSDIDVVLADKHRKGYTLGASVTLDTNRYFSHEFTFDYNRTGFDLEFYSFANFSDDAAVQQDYELEPSTMSTTEAAYNLLIHARPKGRRLRPYLLVGPSVRLMHLTDAPIKKASPYFKLGLGTVGLLTAAYEYGTTPPLNGGGVFQVGLQYGSGVQYRFARRWLARVDYKETFTPQPEFFSTDPSDIWDPADLAGYTLLIDGPFRFGKMRQQRVTSGVSFVF